MQSQASAHLQAVWADVPVVINLVLVPERHQVTVNINDIFSVQRYAVTRLVLLAHTLGKQPVQNTEVNVHGPELPAVVFQVLLAQAVREMVEFNESAVAEHYPEMFTSYIPEFRYREGLRNVIISYLAGRQQCFVRLKETLSLDD